MRSVRVQIDEPARKDDPEKTRAQKKKSDWLVNADPKLIGDPTRTEGPSGTTLRNLPIEPSDRRCNLVRAEVTCAQEGPDDQLEKDLRRIENVSRRP
jgi:hypothetical protein